MTIRAADLALRDFRLDTSPRASAVGIGRNIGDLVAQVIELEHDDVRFAAVHAWVGREVLNDPATILSPSGSDVPQQARLLRFSILSVVLTSISSETVAAPGLDLRLAPPHGRELVQRLQFAAFRARSHEGERAVRSTSRE
jgi:hypothetical protein